MLGLVGDGLLEPFWPTRTGIARGFLGAFDAVWMVRQWASGDMSPIEIMEERETILKLLPQTTQENITKDFKNMTIVPKSRYPNLPKHLYSSQQVRHLYSSETPDNADLQRYLHPNFEEIVAKIMVKKKHSRQPVNSNRMLIDHSEVKIPELSTTSDVNANEFYKTMREKRRNDMKNESDKSEPAKLRERIEVRRGVENKPTRREQMNEKTILNDDKTKIAFLKKMSNAFGYDKPNDEDANSSETEQNVDQKSAKPRPQRNIKMDQASTSNPKTKKTRSFDFSDNNNELHSSVAPINPKLDMTETDPELDFLLASLEHDEKFANLVDNDQQAWLESLFFQDTTHLPGRVGPQDQLSQTNPNPRNTLRVNSSTNSRT